MVQCKISPVTNKSSTAMVQYNVIPYNIRVEYTRVQNKLFPYNVRVEYTMVQCKLFPMTFEWSILGYNIQLFHACSGFGFRQQFSSHLQHLGSIVLTAP
jgi:hypothetical protein